VNRFAVSLTSGVIALLVTLRQLSRKKSAASHLELSQGTVPAAMESTATLNRRSFRALLGSTRRISNKDCGLSGSANPPSDELLYWLFNHAESKKIAASNSPEALANMVGIAHALTPQEIKEAAAWYSHRNQSPLPGTPPISRLGV